MSGVPVADTIAAIATPAGWGAIGIVRLSGPLSLAIARGICPWLPDEVTPRQALVGSFVCRGTPVDEGLVLSFAAPRSFTGEDVVELQGHGGLPTQLVLEAALARGARAAGPGEFTQRAFLNGRIDLVQAEAVALLIAAQSERAAQKARAILGGSLSRKVTALLDQVTALRGRIEGLLDFPVEAEGAEEGLVQALDEAARAVCQLAGTYAAGRGLFARSQVVLAGPVNAGKSSLLNALVGEERALVDEAPGTTRDRVECDISLAGLPVRLVDTAGWREAQGVEARGIEVGRQAARDADLTLWIVDGARPEPIPFPGWLGVVNKIDLINSVSNVYSGFLAVSARDGIGLDALRAAIAARLGGSAAGTDDDVVVAGARQAHGLELAYVALERASACAHSRALELAAEELAAASRALSGVVGRDVPTGVLAEVFSQFCIGK